MSSDLPHLECPRLILRPFTLADADRVQELAGDRRVYETTLNVPHPYKNGIAEEWIATHKQQFAADRGVTLAMSLRDDDTVIGTIGLGVSPHHKRAELGYWVGVPYWNQGYCTEATREIIRYGFEHLGLHKIASRHLASNPASGRVMQKVGMIHEGTMIDEVVKDGEFHTLVVYGLIHDPSRSTCG